MKRRLRALGLAAVGFACSDGNDADLYARALGAETLEHATGFCRRVQSTSTRDHCIAASVQTLGATALTAPAVCGEIDSVTWQSECFFFVADTLASTGDSKAALEMCERSELFQANCAMHVFAEKARRLQSEHGLSTAAELYGQALSDLEDIALARDAALDRRLWTQFFQEALPPEAPVTLTHCEPLSPSLATKCARGATMRLTQQLHAALRGPAALTSACRNQEETGTVATTEALGVRYDTSPTLDAIAAEILSRACRHAPPATASPKGPAPHDP